jgi:GT2 family glycosyltransferase
LDSIAAAFAAAAPLNAEIVVVDNGSTDNTAEIVKGWAAAGGVPVKLLSEPRPGKARALNCALRAAEGELLAFTDDDCRLSTDYVTDLLRHDASDGDDFILRGGRIELGDPTDLPLTIKSTPFRQRFNRRTNPATDDTIIGQISGCNMTMRRAMVGPIGPFDERFGPGSIIGNGEDAEYQLRAYLADISIEYVPDMVVFHHHGRKGKAVGYKLHREYAISAGAMYAKHFRKQPTICLPVYWDIKKAIKEILTGTNLFYPVAGFSFKHKAAYALVGAVKYFSARSKAC